MRLHRAERNQESRKSVSPILLYWFLFVSYHGVVLVLVVLVITRLSSPKTVFICVFYCVFGIGDFAGSSMRKISLFHLFAKSPLLVCYISKGCICGPLSNKIGFMSFGLHLQKIRHFRFSKRRFSQRVLFIEVKLSPCDLLLT